MNCEEASHYLEAFLDHEPGAKEHLEVEEHLKSCPACRSVAQESQEFRSFFAAAAQDIRLLRSSELGSWRQSVRCPRSRRFCLFYLHTGRWPTEQR
jgi:predicted anti-sigma-YlaC factor YlaD